MGQTGYQKAATVIEKEVSDEKTVVRYTRTLEPVCDDDHVVRHAYTPPSNRPWVLGTFIAIFLICLLLVQTTILTHRDVSNSAVLSRRDLQGSDVSSPDVQLAPRSTVTIVDLGDDNSTFADSIKSKAPVHTPAYANGGDQADPNAKTSTQSPTAPVTTSKPVEPVSSITSAPPTIVTVGNSNSASKADPNAGSNQISTSPVTQSSTASAAYSIQASSQADPNAIPVSTSSNPSIASSSIPITITSVSQAVQPASTSVLTPDSKGSGLLLSGSTVLTAAADRIAVSATGTTNQVVQVTSTMSSTKSPGVLNLQSFSSAYMESLSSQYATVSGISIQATRSMIYEISSGITVATLGPAPTACAGIANIDTEAECDANGIIVNAGGTSNGTNSSSMGSGSASASNKTAEHMYTWFSRHFGLFTATYIPTFIGVLLQSAWLVVFTSLKLMEPFYQMSRPEGAPAQACLTANYMASGLSWTFMKAIHGQHHVMLLAGLVQFLLSIVVALISEAVIVAPSAYCKTSLSDHQPCMLRWFINTPIMYMIEALLIGCLISTVVLTYFHHRRTSGILADPSKLSTIADLFFDRNLVEEIRSLPAHATKDQIEQTLEHSRYALGIKTSGSGSCYIGIQKIEGCRNHDEDEVDQSLVVRIFIQVSGFYEMMLDKLAHVKFLDDILAICCTVSLFTIILVYRLISYKNTSLLNTFMNSDNSYFGPNFVLSTVCVVISFFIKRKERNLRLSVPYSLLSRMPTKPAETTITAGVSGTQFTSLFKSIKGRQYLLSSLAATTIFADLLIVMVSGVPFSPASTKYSEDTSVYMSLSLLALIIVTQFAVIIDDYRKSKDPCHYREYPENLATVLHRICASKFVEGRHSEHCSKESTEEPYTKYETLSDNSEQWYEGAAGERRYFLSNMQGIDGIRRWTIDEDMASTS